jgi:hypothetical protein
MNQITPINKTKGKILPKPSSKPYKPLPGSYVSKPVSGIIDYYIHIPIQEFYDKLPRNKHQRFEEDRDTRHLWIPQPEHNTIAVLMGTCGRLALIDGHTRRYLWEKNPAIAPEFVHLHVFEIVDESVNFEDEELRIYSSFDSRRAVKTARHTLQGAISASDLKFKTAWLANGSFSDGMKSAIRYFPLNVRPNINDLLGTIEFFSKELELFDSVTPNKNRFVVPFLTSALLALRVDPSKGMTEALRNFSTAGGGIQIDRKVNAMARLNAYRSEGLGATVNNCGDKVKCRTFPTNTGDVEIAISQIFPLLIEAAKNPTTLHSLGGRGENPLNPMLKTEIMALLK